MPLSLYSAWLQPMRVYGSSASSGGPTILPNTTSLANYSTGQQTQQQHINLNHLQATTHQSNQQLLHKIHQSRFLSTASSGNNYSDESDDDGSLSPTHDISKSQHGECFILFFFFFLY